MIRYVVYCDVYEGPSLPALVLPIRNIPCISQGANNLVQKLFCPHKAPPCESGDIGDIGDLSTPQGRNRAHSGSCSCSCRLQTRHRTLPRKGDEVCRIYSLRICISPAWRTNPCLHFCREEWTHLHAAITAAALPSTKPARASREEAVKTSLGFISALAYLYI